MTDTAIRASNLSKRYQLYDAPHDRLKQFILPRLMRMAGKTPKSYFREFWALNNVSFEIKKGETVGVIGRNGSGKSTLLQIICGTLAPTDGAVETNGRVAAVLELGSGFNPEFTGRENVYMNAAVLGLSKEEIDECFDDIAAFADIGQFIEQPVKTYSSGMYVRLAFAVNILSKPEIMIVDEALAVGDMNFQAKCMTALTRIQERGATVLFVSHDIGALKSLCSRGIYLERGAIISAGLAGDVAEQYVRAMREEMNAESLKHERAEPASGGEKTQANAQTAPPRLSGQVFKRSEEFEKQAANFRYGTGGARITFAELLDDEQRPIRHVGFDQAVFIRIHFESGIDRDVSANYYILDGKKNLIMGSGLLQAGHPLLTVKKGGRYVVTYKTRFPLHEGNHSIQLQIASPIILGATAEFHDVIDDALVFQVAPRENGRIWTQVYILNKVEISYC